MTLTYGQGPLSPNRLGRFSEPIPDKLVYVEPYQRRIRGLIGGRVVVDTERALMVHRTGGITSLVFPEAEVHGMATTPEPHAPGWVRLDWFAVEEWFEENERIVKYPRNPYHRVDCLPTSRRLRVCVDDVEVLRTTTTVGVYETGSPPRLYVDRVYLDGASLEPSATPWWCPYKGHASYWNLRVGDSVIEDAAWSYDEPLSESMLIRGLLSFDDTKVHVEADLPSAAVIS